VHQHYFDYYYILYVDLHQRTFQKQLLHAIWILIFYQKSLLHIEVINRVREEMVRAVVRVLTSLASW
jgi:hypothetical protein